jgi:hypothetical protein
MSLIVQRDVGEGTVVLKLRGAIDENAALPPIFQDLPAKVEFRLNGIERINSVGINRWIALFTQCSQQRTVTVSALSYPVVLQANCISNLFAGATVVSCMAPYFCNACGQRREVLITREQVAESGGTPSPACPDCKGALDFDELDSYFALFKV